MHTARAQGCKSQWFYDKHNCSQRDSIPGPRALQSLSDTLPLDHCDLQIPLLFSQLLNGCATGQHTHVEMVVACESSVVSDGTMLNQSAPWSAPGYAISRLRCPAASATDAEDDDDDDNDNDGGGGDSVRR